MLLVRGRYRSGQTGQTVNLLAYAFEGSNPSLPTIFCVDSHTMTNLPTTIDEEIKNSDPDFETEETLAYILGRISEEIIED